MIINKDTMEDTTGLADLTLHDKIQMADSKKEAEKMRAYVEKNIKKKPEATEPPKKKRIFARSNNVETVIALTVEGLNRVVIAKKLGITLSNVSGIKYRHKAEIRKLTMKLEHGIK